jgi:hypothetical protein
VYPNRACIGLLEFLGGMRGLMPATCFTPLTTLLGAKFSGQLSESPIDCSTQAAANPRALPEAHPVRAYE